MVNKDLAAYIRIISNESIIPVDEVMGGESDKLIYKIILEFKDKEKNSLSTKFVKRLISKLRMLNSTVYKKTQYNRYELKQKFENNLYILEYYQGELKPNKNGCK